MANKSKKKAIVPEFKMNPPMADIMLYEAENDRAEYYKEAYENERAKNERLERQMDNLNESLRIVHDEYVKTDKKYKDALTKSGQILRSAQD